MTPTNRSKLIALAFFTTVLMLLFWAFGTVNVLVIIGCGSVALFIVHILTAKLPTQGATP